MAKKIYIDWNNQEYHTSLDSVRISFEESAPYTELGEFLDCNYSTEAVFNFTEEDRAVVLMEYNALIEEEMEDWVRREMTVIDVDVAFKEE